MRGSPVSFIIVRPERMWKEYERNCEKLIIQITRMKHLLFVLFVIRGRIRDFGKPASISGSKPDRRIPALLSAAIGFWRRRPPARSSYRYSDISATGP